ncbi:hypothetical protein D3C84_802760 [compost metagenome]
MQQKRAARQKGQVDPFHAAPAELAERRVASEEFVHGQAFVDPQAVQRRGLSPGIRRLVETEPEHLLQTTEQVHAVGRRPVGHLLGKGHHHHGKTEHGRVERVLADAAIQVLAEQQRESGSTDRQPPWAIRGQRQCQQRGTDQGAAIAQGWLDGALAQLQHQRFNRQCGHTRQNQVDQHAPAIPPEQHQHPRHRGQQYLLHGLLKAFVDRFRQWHGRPPGARLQ